MLVGQDEFDGGEDGVNDVDGNEECSVCLIAGRSICTCSSNGVFRLGVIFPITVLSNRPSRFLSHSQALESELRPLIRFGQGVCGDWRELLHILQFGFTNATTERFNGTVARVIAKGHGHEMN